MCVSKIRANTASSKATGLFFMEKSKQHHSNSDLSSKATFEDLIFSKKKTFIFFFGNGTGVSGRGSGAGSWFSLASRNSCSRRVFFCANVSWPSITAQTHT